MLAEPYIDTNIVPATTRLPNKERMIDYTNLYIKNLDPQVTSYDLFQRFKDFGKIISARVMKDTQTGISKGFGFVSFTSMDEANMAMQKMQGVKMHYKAISITFHEPRKSVQKRSNMEYVPQQPFQQQQPYPYIYTGNQSPPPPVYGNTYPHHRFVPDHTMSFKQPINDVNGWAPPQQPTQVKNTASSVVPPYAYSPMHHTHTATTNNAFESNHFIVSPPLSLNAPVPPPPGYSHHLERTTSNDSSSATSFQRQKLREAISIHLKSTQNRTNDLEDLVDMIQSLKKRELSLCLFNPTFLKQKITEAYKALYIFDEEEQRRKSVSVATTPSLVHRHLDDEKSGDDDDEHSIATLLASLEGKPLNKQKKILGDILFPLVKAAGVRRAPKITIWLLDTVPLDELASVMYDHHELSRMAHYASSQIQSL
ncbi:hypothetical protein K501DRAFT_257128 [Backusella circina FSU 941]|nr:hypothetical protein K501DRAFT_257128 [Backusella circina FSU 941]